jgi:ATP-binding cassette subfamily C protein LapB
MSDDQQNLPEEIHTASAPLSAGLREDLLLDDPLLDSLLEIARIHGRPSTRAALSAGLPLVDGRLTPSLVARAANRVGIACRIIRKDLNKIHHAQLPAILLLNGNEACVLLGWKETPDHQAAAEVLLPGSGQTPFIIPLEELVSRYIGIAMLLHPRVKFDSRAPEVAKLAQRHWFWGTVLDQWRVYRDVLIAAFMINVFALAIPLFSQTVYDRVIPNNALDTLWVLAISVTLLLGLDLLLRMLRAHFVDLASSRIDVQLSAVLMERVLGLKMEAKPPSVGAFASTMKSFETVRDFIASATVATLIDLPFALLFYLAIAWISWPLIFPPIVGFILVGIYTYLIQNEMHALSETTYRAGSLRNATLVESLTAMETIKALGAESHVQSTWEKSAAYLSKTNNQLRKLSQSATTSVATIQQLVSIAVLITGVYMVHDGSLSQGGLIACTMLAGRAMAPLGQLAGLLIQYQGAKTSLESLNKLMEKKIERPPESTFVHRPEIRGGIEFRGVTFGYPDADPVLKNVSFKINPGESVVFLGRVGSGKSTIQKLVLGFYEPQEGSVLVDGIDLRQLDPADLRRNIGYVSQDAILFYGTLRDNIAYGAPYADDSAIVAAMELAGLRDFVNRHPMGFDMPISERGDSLSGGQRQCVAIARAFLMDPPVLLLDEPTSSMDYTTENEFKIRLSRFAKRTSPGKTVLISTHRSSLIDLADRIIVIDNGQILADGPREQVVSDLRAVRVGKPT